jgi:hypothetical protein
VSQCFDNMLLARLAHACSRLASMLPRLASIENTWPARPAPCKPWSAATTRSQRVSFSVLLCVTCKVLKCTPNVVGGEWEVD